jgi:hypothetical protein
MDAEHGLKNDPQMTQIKTHFICVVCAICESIA